MTYNMFSGMLNAVQST